MLRRTNLALANVEISYENDCDKSIHSKGNEGSYDAKEENICDVLEKLLAVHVESSGKDNWRQHKVEEHGAVKLHQVVEHSVCSLKGNSQT